MNLLHKFFLNLQDAYIKINSLIPPSVIHNTEKHAILKKFLFYAEIEGIKGDYLEFGTYEGSSLKGAAAYWRRIGSRPMKFYGFDSFEGMDPKKEDNHPFYTTFDFSTDFEAVKKRFRGYPEVFLVKGFFDKTLGVSPSKYSIGKAAIIMVDCDLHSSSKEAFNFIKPVVQEGTILILDDYFNYKADEKKGVKGAFDQFIKEQKIKCQEVARYGIGGAVFIICK